MKPFVYLAAFERGDFTLETLVPDEPISVPNGAGGAPKWIANYDGQFKGLIPMRRGARRIAERGGGLDHRQIGIDAVLRTSRALGVQTPSAALCDDVVGRVGGDPAGTGDGLPDDRIGTSWPSPTSFVRSSAGRVEPVAMRRQGPVPLAVDADTLALIQEGLRGVVRMPTGTAHALTARDLSDRR